ncbi:MAG: type IV pilus modification protein PilV [Stenotrophobium sp.]
MQGFTMVEVLVALVILSIGLLGVAGLQLSGVRDTQDSYFRSQATIAMNDLAERIYANVPAAQAAEYGGYDSSVIDCGTAPAKICARETTTGTIPPICSSAEMATYDEFVASCGMPNGAGRSGGIADLVPQGKLLTTCLDRTGAVDATCAVGDGIRITVQWNERQAKEQGGAIVAQSMDMVIQP